MARSCCLRSWLTIAAENGYLWCAGGTHGEAVGAVARGISPPDAGRPLELPHVKVRAVTQAVSKSCSATRVSCTIQNRDSGRCRGGDLADPWCWCGNHGCGRAGSGRRASEGQCALPSGRAMCPCRIPRFRRPPEPRRDARPLLPYAGDRDAGLRIERPGGCHLAKLHLARRLRPRRPPDAGRSVRPRGLRSFRPGRVRLRDAQQGTGVPGRRRVAGLLCLPGTPFVSARPSTVSPPSCSSCRTTGC